MFHGAKRLKLCQGTETMAKLLYNADSSYPTPYLRAKRMRKMNLSPPRPSIIPPLFLLQRLSDKPLPLLAAILSPDLLGARFILHHTSLYNIIPETVVTKMAPTPHQQPVNYCNFRTRYRADGSPYRVKINDYGSTNCPYSVNYVPPLPWRPGSATKQ
jgi:hypothetical protein